MPGCNRLLARTPFAHLPLDKLIQDVAGDEKKSDLFNNAAQLWNHEFYWRSMKPEHGGQPSGDLARRIKYEFGSYDNLAESFLHAAVALFGCGWVWLVIDAGRLALLTTDGADTPLAHGLTPLLAIDMWEHAYYLDYQDQRAEYVSSFLDHLVDWERVAQRLAYSPVQRS